MIAREASKLVVGSVLVYATISMTGNRGLGSRFDRVDVLSGAVSSANAETAQSGAELKATYLAGADGSRQFLGWRDAARNEECSFSVAADGAWRCLPSGAVTGRFFGDAACSQPIALAPKGCTAPAYAIRRDASLCGPTSATHVFTLGSPFAGSVAYESAGGVCVAVTSADLVFHDLYTIGDELPGSSFVQATTHSDP